MAINLKFHSNDNDNCRVYYTDARGRLYCFQILDYRAKTFELLTCSRDGEPSCPVDVGVIGNVEPARGDESIALEFNAFAGSPAWRDLNKHYRRADLH